ncbi:LLM class flavin-dependent oxidoreductase [Micromonospora sp. NPDC005686]|uniref:LLM class flavin-dependent oxidoreductase n=1 Tax=unclassified Micromonospora TaxID=2617518 RepID=UPI0033B09FF7
MDLAARGVTIYSTCRSSIGYGQDSHLRKLLETARWADEAGYRGALLYSDNTSIDAWMSAQAAIANTAGFVPLIAVQPLDKSPFALARAISSLAHLYGRQVDLNYVSGGFSRDLRVQGDALPHDARYDRLVEYVTIVRALLDGGLTSHEGRYYNFRRARLTTPVPADLLPTAYVSGSSAASLQAGESLGLSQLSFPLLPAEFASPDTRKNRFGAGISIGIIARDDSSEAWRIAHKRFPADPDGAERMKLLLSAAVSSWQPQLASVPIADEGEGGAYWLVPFRYHHTFCPYLVGSYDEVAQAVATYLKGGARTFVFDLPQEPDDLYHTRIAVERAVAALDGEPS